MVGDKIRQAREAKGLSQEYMAEQLGISQPAYCNLENGKLKPKPQRLAEIARLLDADVQAWLADDDAYVLHINYNQGNKEGSVNAQVLYYNQELIKELLKAKDAEIATLREMLQLYKNLSGMAPPAA